MYQAAIEGLLGLRRTGESFRVEPCIPSVWEGFTLDWRVGGSRYRITVTNPEHKCRGVRSVALDGKPVDPRAIPLADDGAVHEVVVVLGEAAALEVGATRGAGHADRQ
jgi:cyclic beta-1,2-glucan synthetase